MELQPLQNAEKRLHPRYRRPKLSRAILGVLRITSYLPLPLLGLLGYGLGALLYALGRGKVVAINLRLCFPEASSWQRFVWGLRHFMAQGRTFLELGVQWWQPLHRTTGYVTLHGAENLNAHSGKPVILLTPHFVGFNIGSAKISATWPCAGMYSENKDPQFDKMLRLGRTRFGAPTLLTKQDGLRQIVRTLKAGDRPLIYLPDMNFSARDCVFVPFFGVPAATLTAVARLAQLSGAVVLPVVTKQLSVWRGYETHIGTPWENYPEGDAVRDARRLNAFVEASVLTMPHQYFWVHRRFGTRPPGEPDLYR